MRQGELLALKSQDVNLERGALSVRASLRYFHGRFVFSEPKTKSARRTVPLTPRAIAALHAHRARQLEERVAMGEAWEQSNLVFCTHRGGPLEATNFVKQSFLPLLTRAGLPRIRFHEPQPHGGDDCHRARRAHQGRLGDAGARLHLDHPGRVLARDPGDAGCRRQDDGTGIPLN